MANKYQPRRKTKKAAGADLQAAYDYIIPAGKATRVDTGYMIPENHLGKDLFFALLNRSGNGNPDTLLLLTNGIGAIDEDYRDTIKVTFLNMSTKTQHIKKGDRIAQIIVLEHLTGEFFDADDTERTGGFNSTGKE